MKEKGLISLNNMEEKIQLEAVRKNRLAIKYIDNPMGV